MKFKFQPKNLPLLIGAFGSALIVFADWTDAQSATAIGILTAITAVLGWTE